jgi:hypothetical protein
MVFGSKAVVTPDQDWRSATLASSAKRIESCPSRDGDLGVDRDRGVRLAMYAKRNLRVTRATD